MNKNHKKKNNSIEKSVNENSSLDEVKVKEPRPVCSICGEPIEAIIEAIRENDGSYSHFDCVLQKLEKEYNVQAPDKISYIGAGTFAIVTVQPNTKEFSIKQRINYESVDSYNQMKKFVEESRV